MRFNPITCPDCGEQAKGMLENVPGIALFTITDGEAEYDGETKMDWDGQESVIKDGKITLVCHNGHEWLATQE